LVYFGDETNAVYKEIYLAFAEKYANGDDKDKIEMVHCVDPECAKTNAVKSPGFIFQRQFKGLERESIIYKDELVLEALYLWVRQMQVQSVSEFTSKVTQHVVMTNQAAIVLLRSATNTT